MGLLADLFLGKREHAVFTDPRVGELTASFRRGRRDGWCAWEGSLLLDGQSVRTSISLSGTQRGPHSEHLVQLHRVLDELQSIAAKADLVLKPGASFRDFRLQSIVDWDEHDNVLELAFVPMGEARLEREVTIFWPDDDELSNHHVVFRAG